LEDQAVTKKLYVGNLSYDTTEDTLRELFAAIGEVASVALITDRQTGRSKGFAFVEMTDDAAAQKAITDLNSKEVDGRTIKVAEARPPRQDAGGPRGPRRDDRGPGGDDRRPRW
jgi:cold-inducible RNA-binding protein